LIGAPPKTSPGETASTAERQEARRLERLGKALPDKPLRFRRWDRIDAEVRLIGKHVLRAPALPVNALDARARLSNAVLRLEPLKLDTAGGQVVATIELDGGGAVLHSNARVQFHNLGLAELFPTVKAMREAKGRAHGRATFVGQDNSVASMLGASEGHITLAVNEGAISNLMLELMGLDAGEALRIFATKDRTIPLKCGILDLDVHKGIGTTNILVLDTADTLVVGAGTVDLRHETLDLTLYPRPKDASILVARAPLHVRGTLRNPSVLPDPKSLTVRALGAVLLGFVNPLLALVPLIETGPGRDSDCSRLMNTAQKWACASTRA